MKGYIYIIKNTCNDKVYIGQTSRTIQDRWKQHKASALRGEEQGIILYNAMRKYGIDKFYISQLEECDLEQINESEIYWIQYYNSQTPNGYNVRAGGEDPGRKEVYKMDENNQIIECYGSAMAAAEANNVDLSLLTKVCRKEEGHNSAGGFKWCYVNDYDTEYLNNIKIKKSTTSVYQMDNTTGKIIKKWNSIAEAVQELHIQQSDISHCLSGRYKTAGGFGWCTEDNVNTFKPYKKEKSIIQLDKKNNFIKEWTSAKDAATFLSKDASTIRKAARGDRKTAYGYIWKYKEE